ncbi:MAG: AAA family ATPase [Candidatus Kaiserbacteria bacterium]|nr:AAA family ATPase [Candidatus Kaiserbacteria bacterium]
MKIAFVGKGGSGKTTLASILARRLSARKLPVLAIDADINQHLGVSLGLSEEDVSRIPAMGLEVHRIKEYLIGSNAAIGSVSEMVKTTPPGTGSQLLTVTEDNTLYRHFVKEVDGIRFMAVGPFTEEDLGVRCYHSKTGSVELVLNHLIDKAYEYVLVDMTAGADSFASGLFTRFDVTFLVVEPTMKSVRVYEQYKKYAKQYDVCVRVIGNKVEDESDNTFIREHVRGDLAATFSHSRFVRSMEKGVMRPLSDLEPENVEALEKITAEADRQQKDWGKYYAQAVEFHRKNAASWASAAVGVDVTLQIDPSFSLKDVVASHS